MGKLAILAVALLCGQCRADEPHYMDLQDRFAGAVLMLRHNSPVPMLGSYRNNLLALSDADARVMIPNFQQEKSHAYFAWDIWDDLQNALKSYEHGDLYGCTWKLQMIRHKIGPYAYDLGWMPEIPERAYYVNFFPKPAVQMPPGPFFPIE